MVKYACKRCNFKFVPKGGRVPKKCPYCSREDTLAPEATAQDILDNSEEF